MNFISYRSLVQDVRNWIDYEPIFRQASGVVGIARSGMIPATMIATTLNLPLVDLETFLHSGGRFYPNRQGGEYHDTSKLSILRVNKRILLVDDSIHEGSTMRAAMREIGAHLNLTQYNITPMAVYSTGMCSGVRSFCEIQQPRLFEWNWTRHKIMEETLCDMDGVLCFDPPDGLRGAAFREWACSVEARYIPTRRLRMIVTSRVQANRPVTETWLERHRIQYQELKMIMTEEEYRDKHSLSVTHKIKAYTESASPLFVESNEKHAQKIQATVRKPVLCVPPSGEITLIK